MRVKAVRFVIAFLSLLFCLPGAAQVAAPTTEVVEEEVEFSSLDLSEQKDILAGLSDEQVRSTLLEILDLKAQEQASADKPMLNVSQINRNFLIFKEGINAGVSAIPRIPELFNNYLTVLFPNWQAGTGLKLVLGCLFIFFLGWLAEYFYLKRTRALVEAIVQTPAQRFSKRIKLLGQRLIIRLLGVFIFAMVTLLAYFIFAPGHEPLRIALLAYIASVVMVRVVIVCSRFLFAPFAAGLRIFPISCEQARTIHRLNIFLACYCGLFLMTEFVMKQLGLNQLLVAAWGTLFGQTFSVLMVISTWIIHKPIRQILLDGSKPQGISGFVYQNWHWLASFALVMVDLIAGYALILENRNVVVPAIATDVIIISIPIFIAIVRKLIDDAFDHSRIDPVGTEEVAMNLDNPDESAVLEQTFSDELPQTHASQSVLSGLSGITSFLLGVGALVLVFMIWGYRVDELIKATAVGRILSSFIELIVIIAVAYVIWSIASYFMQPYMPDEGISGPGDEAGGTGVSRISTLMPIFKKLLFGLLVLVTSMIYLSQLGVDIGPLLAGAGIIGIAIGFGAQTLVKDVISGMFYLIDDAFRKGEYIEIGEIRGTVENISIRSFQLRHHNGPVHTVPYGDITSLTNYSRDWVIMKFEIRIPFETDVEMVRKLIKKVGAEMLQDEEFKPMMIDQLKSQGVNRMDDSALIVRCKFTCHPGHQFYLRRVAYARIQKAFEDNDIQFAPKRVIVEAHTPQLAVAAAGALDEEKPEDKKADPF